MSFHPFRNLYVHFRNLNGPFRNSGETAISSISQSQAMNV